MIEHDIKFDETRAYSKKFDPSINGDISFSYRINKKKISHEFSIKMLNVVCAQECTFTSTTKKLIR